MITIEQISDPVSSTKDHYSKIDRFFLGFIRDKRDLPFVYLTLTLTFTLIPMAVLLFLPIIQGWIWWGIAAIYFIVNNFVFKGPFGLMLHCTSHRKLFKRKYEWMNYYLPWVIGPFFGQTPETYFSHHVGMHHPENNLPDDKSTTMFYQRNSFRSWLVYFGDFMILGLIKLSGYFARKNRERLLRKTIIGESSFLLLCLALLFVRWEAALVVFLLPFLISRIIMMLGNWAQHAFVDENDPGNPYKNSITCINVKYNHKCWNDGYHISHHIRPAMHWTEHPKHLVENADEYARNKAVIFDGLDFVQVFYYLMTGNYNKLAAHYLDIGNHFSSREEIIAHMKRLNEKITEYPPKNAPIANA